MMKNQEKNKITYTKEMLIKDIANEYSVGSKTVRTVYNALEEKMTQLLSSANPDMDVTVRLFEGISINSTFLPEKNKVNNLTGELIVTTRKIKPKANITRSYCEKLTNYNK